MSRALSGFFPFLSPHYFPLFIRITGACLCRDVGAHNWFVRFCQPSVQSPSWELAANSGSSRMGQASNLHLVTQLLTYISIVMLLLT